MASLWPEQPYGLRHKIKLKFFYSDKPNDKWEFVHVAHLSSHFGRDRLHNKVSQMAYGITREVCAAIVKACIYCRQRNNHITKPGYTPIIPKYPRERLIADLICYQKYGKYNDGYNYLFDSVDSFSKFAIVYPLKEKSAKQVYQCFLKIIRAYGTPYIIHTDNGKEFKNADIVGLCNKYNTKFVHGLPRYPQSQGQVERLNQTLKNSIADTTRSKNVYPRWIDHHEEIVFDYNSVNHGTTGWIPFDVFFGNIHKIMPDAHKNAIDSGIKYYTNNDASINNNDISDNKSIIEMSEIPDEYKSYLLYKDEINKQLKNNIVKLGKYEAKRRKWRNDEDEFEIGDRVLRLFETDNNPKTKKAGDE